MVVYQIRYPIEGDKGGVQGRWDGLQDGLGTVREARVGRDDNFICSRET